MKVFLFVAAAIISFSLALVVFTTKKSSQNVFWPSLVNSQSVTMYYSIIIRYEIYRNHPIEVYSVVKKPFLDVNLLEPSDIDPAALQALINDTKETLAGMELPEELHDLFQQMVDDPSTMSQILADNWEYLKPYLQPNVAGAAEERRFSFSVTGFVVKQVIRQAVKAIRN